MAKELARFQNFAKLKDTEVAFNDITVIAGKPGTGKSYVMKFMYAIDEAYSLLSKDIDELFSQLNNIRSRSNNMEEILLEEILEFYNGLHKYKKVTENSSNKNTSLILKEKLQQKIPNLLNSIFMNIEEISKSFIVNSNSIIIDYDKTFKLTINNKVDNEEDFTMHEVIFVETPLILEFKKFMRREEGKTPYHIESLLNILDTDYSFTDAEQDKFIKDFTQKSKETIKGNIESSGDSFIFNKDNDKNYDIINASSGTKSIGLLQYLVTNKALKKGSVLYWEEPEVHLHPEWQLRMIELFIELMNAGVKIVFSTHSTFMVDSLNALSKKEDFSDRVSFNLFKETDGIVENHILEADKEWKLIQDELLKSSLEEIMWQYL